MGSGAKVLFCRLFVVGNRIIYGRVKDGLILLSGLWKSLELTCCSKIGREDVRLGDKHTKRQVSDRSKKDWFQPSLSKRAQIYTCLNVSPPYLQQKLTDETCSRPPECPFQYAHILPDRNC